MKTTKHDDGLNWLHDIRARLAKLFDSHAPRKMILTELVFPYAKDSQPAAALA